MQLSGIPFPRRPKYGSTLWDEYAVAESILWFESDGTGRMGQCLRMCPEQTFRLRPAEAGGARRCARLAKSLLEPRVVAYGSEIVVPARLLAEGWVQLH
jgi:hypothetical protein